MATLPISGGTVHKLPADIRRALTTDQTARATWQDLTSLARNEWICWTTFVKKQETRRQHIQRLIGDLRAGKRRPCCWLGCVHRTDKPVSPSVQAMLEVKNRSRRG